MNDFAKEWVAALRSGEYKQGREYLQKGDEYCCLGVVCDLFQKKFGGLEVRTDSYGRTIYGGNAIYLPSPVKEALNLQSINARYIVDGDHAFLTNDNDDGKTFEEIAAIIESEPEGLFNEN